MALQTSERGEHERVGSKKRPHSVSFEEGDPEITGEPKYQKRPANRPMGLSTRQVGDDHLPWNKGDFDDVKDEILARRVLAHLLTSIEGSGRSRKSDIKWTTKGRDTWTLRFEGPEAINFAFLTVVSKICGEKFRNIHIRETFHKKTLAVIVTVWYSQVSPAIRRVATNNDVQIRANCDLRQVPPFTDFLPDTRMGILELVNGVYNCPIVMPDMSLGLIGDPGTDLIVSLFFEGWIEFSFLQLGGLLLTIPGLVRDIRFYAPGSSVLPGAGGSKTDIEENLGSGDEDEDHEPDGAEVSTTRTRAVFDIDVERGPDLVVTVLPWVKYGPPYGTP